MYTIYKSLKTAGSICEIDVIGDKILIADNVYVVYFLDVHTFAVQESKKLANNQPEWHNYYKGISFGIKETLCLPFKESKKFYILRNQEGKIQKLALSDWFEGDIESSCFSHDGKLLAVGGVDGRLGVFSPLGQPIYCLERRPEYIACVRFSDNGRYLASSAFDGSVWVYDTELCTIVANFMLDGDIIEDIAFYDKGEKLYAVTRNGNGIIFNIHEKTMVSKEAHFAGWANTVAISLDGTYAYVGTRGDNFYIIELAENYKVSSIKLHESGLSKLKVVGNFLMMGFMNGTLSIINVYDGLDELEIGVKIKDWEKVKSLLDKNVFLRVHPLAKRFEEAWKDVLDLAIKAIAIGQVEKAFELAQPFLDDERRDAEFTFYLSQTNDLVAFFDAVDKRELKKAYELAESKKYLKKTAYYTQLESHWAKLLSNVRKMLEDNPVINKKKAEELLRPFMMIPSKKEVIFNLLTKTHLFKDADEALKAQDFAKYFQITDKYPFLQESSTYERTLVLGKSLYDRMLAFERERKFVDAIKVAQTLSNFSPYKEKALNEIDFVRKLNAFLLMIKSKNYPGVYEAVHKNELFRGVPEFAVLKEDFEKEIEDAVSIAAKGDVSSLKDALLKYEPIRVFQERIRSLYQTAYINAMFNDIKHDRIDWERTIKNYIAAFGRDSNIEKIGEKRGLPELLKGVRTGFSYQHVLVWL